MTDRRKSLADQLREVAGRIPHQPRETPEETEREKLHDVE